MAWPGVRAGGHREPSAPSRPSIPQTDVAIELRRRGRQDHLLRLGHRAAHERNVRGRHRRVHRPDGDAAAYGCERPQRARRRRDHASIRSRAAAACSPRPTCSRCSTRAPVPRTSPPRSSRPWSPRPSPASPADGPSAATSPSWAARCAISRSCAAASTSRSTWTRPHRIVPRTRTCSSPRVPPWRTSRDKLSTFGELIDAIDALGDTQGAEVARLEPLFATEADYAAFKARHDAEVVPRGDAASCTGERVFIGLDAGSTTMKAAMVGEDGQLLHTWYGNNNGDILGTAKAIMADFYAHMPAGARSATSRPPATARRCSSRRSRPIPARSRPSPTCAAPALSCRAWSSSSISAART